MIPSRRRRLPPVLAQVGKCNYRYRVVAAFCIKPQLRVVDILRPIRAMGGGDKTRRLKVTGAIYPPVSDRVMGASRTLKNACEEFDLQQVHDLLPLLVDIPICIETLSARVVGVVTASTKTHGGGIDIEFEVGGDSQDCEDAMRSLESGTLSGLSLAHRYEKEPGCEIVITPIEVSLCDTPKRKTFTRHCTRLVGHHKCSAGEERMQHIYQVGGTVRIVGKCEMSLPNSQEDPQPGPGVVAPTAGPPITEERAPPPTGEEAPEEPKEGVPPEKKEEVPPKNKEEVPLENTEAQEKEEKSENDATDGNEAAALLDRAANQISASTERITVLQSQLNAERAKTADIQKQNLASMARLSSLLSTEIPKEPEETLPRVDIVADVHKASASALDRVADKLRQQESTIKQQRATINYTAGFGEREAPDTHMQGECAASAKRSFGPSDFAGTYRNEVECKGFVSRRRLKQMYEEYSADACSGVVQASNKRAKTANGLLASRVDDHDEGTEEVSTAQVCPELMDKIMSYVTGATPTGDTLDRIIKSSQ